MPRSPAFDRSDGSGDSGCRPGRWWTVVRSRALPGGRRTSRPAGSIRHMPVMMPVPCLEKARNLRRSGPRSYEE